jgi:hypothetical protein
MTDTPPDVAALHRRLLMERSGEERLKMAVSMNQTARALVWASIPKDLPETERRVQFFLRLYGSDFSPERRDEIIAAIHERG